MKDDFTETNQNIDDQLESISSKLINLFPEKFKPVAQCAFDAAILEMIVVVKQGENFDSDTSDTKERSLTSEKMIQLRQTQLIDTFKRNFAAHLELTGYFIEAFTKEFLGEQILSNTNIIDQIKKSFQEVCDLIYNDKLSEELLSSLGSSKKRRKIKAQESSQAEQLIGAIGKSAMSDHPNQQLLQPQDEGSILSSPLLKEERLKYS